MPTFTDQTGTIHFWEKTPSRIVSLVPSQTELLYDLGLEANIVGITKFCVHPFHLKKTKSIVGGTKQVDVDKIRALQPDIIIANKEENTFEMVQQLQEICTVWVTNISNLKDNAQMIADFGQIFNKRTEAQFIIDKIQARKEEFLHFIKQKPKLKVAYFIWANPYMVVGKDTFIHEMLQINHFNNIYGNKTRYPEVELKKIRMEGDPDLVLLSSEPFPFKEEHAFEIGRFTHHAKTIFVDGELFSWYGSRILKSFDYFKKIHQRIGY